MTRSKTLATRFAAVFGILLVIAAFWIAFPWRTTDTVEEWGIYWNFDIGSNLVSYAAQTFTTRPFFLTPFLLGYWFDPNSFFGLTFVLVCVLFVTAVLSYAIVKRLLPGHSAVAYLTAILVIIYPADQLIFGLRAVGIHWAFLCYLLSLYLLIAYWQRSRLITLIGVWLAVSFAVLSYEGIYPLVIVGSAALWWLEKRISKRVIKVSLLWYLPIVLWALWAFATQLGTPDTYLKLQAGPASTMPLAENLKAIGMSVVRAYSIHLVVGWRDAVIYVLSNAHYLGVGLAVGVIAFITAWLQNRTESPQKIKVVRYIILFLAALIFIGIGYSSYAVSAGYRDISIRVFYFSAAGGALTFVVGLYLLLGRLQRTRILFLLLGSLLIALASLNAAKQLEQIQYFSDIQQSLLLNIMRQAPKLAPDVAIVVFDDQGVFSQDVQSIRYSQILTTALTYLYDRYDTPVKAIFCYPIQETSDLGEQCKIDGDGVHFLMKDLTLWDAPYDHVIAFSYREGKLLLLDKFPAEFASLAQTESYSPFSLIDRTAPIPYRATTFFDPNGHLTVAAPQSSFVFEFDTPAPGTGWSDPEGSAMWTDSKQSTLYAHLLPGDYILQFRVLGGLTSDILSSLHLEVNNHPIPINFMTDAQGARIYEAQLPADIVENESGETELAFIVNQVVSPKELGYSDDQRTLGLAFDWLRIDPSAK